MSKICCQLTQKICLNKTMSDTKKIAQIKEILDGENKDKVFEIVSLALSVEDEEDRELLLLDVVRWLLKIGIWQKAYGAAQLMAESYEKSEALQAVAEYLSAIGHLEKSLPVFDEAEKTAEHSETLANWQKAERLHQIAASLQKVKASIRADEVWEKAIKIAQQGESSADLQESLDSSSILSEIAESFVSEQKFEKATAIAQRLKNKKEHTLQLIEKHSQQTQRVA